MTLPKFEIVTTTAGAVSIRNNVVNEIMHNPIGPWLEANKLYIEQSQLLNRLNDSSYKEEIVVFDVGLGAAANALATLHCAQSASLNCRNLHLVSFENDLELLAFALDHANQFDHFKGFETGVEAILSKGKWQSEKINWELRKGHFLDTIEVEPTQPHLIFFDPYSPKMNKDMWTTDCFRKIRAKSRDITSNQGSEGTSLFTYSQATKIRTSLLCAGFYVGYGSATGLKEETTVASTILTHLKKPLSTSWRDRWRKSHARYPFDCLVQEQASIDATVELKLAEQISSLT